MIETKQRHRQRGFTMIEMIGVLAVIAILASIVAPKIFDAIRDSKVNTFVANIQAVETAVTNYYKDTSTLPATEKDLNTNSSNVSNWKGPYLDKELTTLFTSLPAGTVTLGAGDPYTGSTHSAFDFDIDGNGTGDYYNKNQVVVIEFNGLSNTDAQAVSNAIDNDGNNAASTNGKAWFRQGRIKVAGAPSTTLALSTDIYAYVTSF